MARTPSSAVGALARPPRASGDKIPEQGVVALVVLVGGHGEVRLPHQRVLAVDEGGFRRDPP